MPCITISPLARWPPSRRPCSSASTRVPASACWAIRKPPDADVIVAGETREWESVEYAADTVASGQKKGMIMLGRILSEDPGMNVCAEWLKILAPEVPVQWLPVGDPYWRPA